MLYQEEEIVWISYRINGNEISSNSDMFLSDLISLNTQLLSENSTKNIIM